MPSSLKMLQIVILAAVIPGTMPTTNYTRRRTDDGPASSAGTMPTAVCGSCKMREEIKSRNLEVIKNEVLRRMGFQSAPNITGRVLPPVPPHIFAKMDLERMQSDQPTPGYSYTDEEDDYHVKTQSVVAFSQPHPRLRHSWRDHDIHHFVFSDSVTKFHVANATLYVYVKGTDRRPLPDVHLQIYKVYKRPDHPETPGFYRILGKKIMQPYGHGEWIKLDLTETTSEWFKSPPDNHGIVINATLAHSGKKIAISGGDKNAPYLEIATTEPHRRIRRSVGLDCNDTSNETLCCRYPLEVSFDDFGWDFVLAPRRYNANICMGECPYITLQKYPHTHLSQMAAPGIAAPCCAPRKMSSITMVYWDKPGNIVVSSLSGMVVDRCGCS